MAPCSICLSVHSHRRICPDSPKPSDDICSPSYLGFVIPALRPIRETDVTISYPMDLKAQMLEFSGKQGAARQ